MTRVLKAVPPAPVDSPALFDAAVVGSMQALSRGDASDHQQRIAFDWIVKSAANIGGQSFRGGDSHATAFMEGRRFVASQIVALLTVDIEKLKRTTNG